MDYSRVFSLDYLRIFSLDYLRLIISLEYLRIFSFDYSKIFSLDYLRIISLDYLRKFLLDYLRIFSPALFQGIRAPKYVKVASQQVVKSLSSCTPFFINTCTLNQFEAVSAVAILQSCARKGPKRSFWDQKWPNMASLPLSQSGLRKLNTCHKRSFEMFVLIKLAPKTHNLVDRYILTAGKKMPKAIKFSLRPFLYSLPWVFV